MTDSSTKIIDDYVLSTKKYYYRPEPPN